MCRLLFLLILLVCEWPVGSKTEMNKHPCHMHELNPFTYPIDKQGCSYYLKSNKKYHIYWSLEHAFTDAIKLISTPYPVIIMSVEIYFVGHFFWSGGSFWTLLFLLPFCGILIDFLLLVQKLSVCLSAILITNELRVNLSSLTMDLHNCFGT